MKFTLFFFYHSEIQIYSNGKGVLWKMKIILLRACFVWKIVEYLICNFLQPKEKMEVVQQAISWMKAKGLLLILVLLVLVLLLLVVLIFSIVVVLALVLVPVFRSQINELKLKFQSIITNVNKKVVMHKHKFIKVSLKMLCVCVIAYVVAPLAFNLRFWQSEPIYITLK